MKRIILASNSPRRRELLGGLDLDFEVKVLPDIDESYPDNLPAAEVAGYISREKAAPYRTLIGESDKAGAYGIQEWIGYVGVTSINGSYFNVMGLPVQRLWEEIKNF